VDGQRAISSVDDDYLIRVVESARRRLLVVSPGLSMQVAEAIGVAWQRLGPKAVNVIMDVDPEVCRLGYGCVEAIAYLEERATGLGAMLCSQPGIRIGLVVADDATLVFAPVPELVEAGTEAQKRRVNAIQIGELPDQVAAELGYGDIGSIEHVWGLDPVLRREVDALKDDLAQNPPVKFDVARIVRVFNARFEFVEFEVKGCLVSRKTVRIPSDLMGLARDVKTQRLLRSSFKVVEEQSELSGERVFRLKKFITDKYLVSLPNYGTAILRPNRAEFEADVEILKRYIERFRTRIVAQLQQEMDSNREALSKALAPAVMLSPPLRWQKSVGPAPSREEVQGMLGQDLQNAFGSAEELVKDMEVRLVFKGVTYDLLNDEDFINVATKAFPILKSLHEEFNAARQAHHEQMALGLQ